MHPFLKHSKEPLIHVNTHIGLGIVRIDIRSSNSHFITSDLS